MALPLRYWNMARQRHCRRLARNGKPAASLLTPSSSEPRTPAGKARVLDARKWLRERDGLSAGGRWIRTVGPPVGYSIFRDRPGRGDAKPARQPEPGFDDRQAQVYRAPSQAGPGNDINAWSPGYHKAPTRGPDTALGRARQFHDRPSRGSFPPVKALSIALTPRKVVRSP